jgi:ribose-phosphate pyrophosphokinase
MDSIKMNKHVDFVFSGGESENIAKYLNQELNIPIGDMEVDVFPDSEHSIEIPTNISGKNIIYIKSTHYPQDKNLIELFLVLDAFKRYKINRLNLVIPYYAYARQDKIFKEGQSKSAETIARIIASLTTPKSYVYTIDSHFFRGVGSYRLFDTKIRAYNITAISEISKYIKIRYKPENTKIVIPDKGHRPTYNYIKEIFDTDFFFLSKERLSFNKVKITCDQDTLILKDSDVIIYDDLIGTGGTILECIEWLKTKNVSRIFVAATHLVYPYNQGTQKFEDIGKKIIDAGANEIISTNTTNIKVKNQISIAPLIKRAIFEKNLLNINFK